MTALQWFRFYAKEYAGLTDVEVEALLAIATILMPPNCLTGDQANAALALYAAHLNWINVNGSESTRGDIKREKEGDLEREYAVGSNNSSKSLLERSPYGLQFDQITLGCFGGGPLTRFGSVVPQGVEVIGYGWPYYRP